MNESIVRLTKWLILIGVSDRILAALVAGGVIAYFTKNYPDLNSHNKTLLSFDGKMTFSDGKLTLFVDNNQDTSTKKLSIYGVEKKNPIRISVSDMIDSTDNKVKHEDITFNGKPSLPINNNGSMNLSIPYVASGSLQGWIVINGKNNSSIPITIAADPKKAEASAWIIVGILTSIFFWEIILYFKPAKPSVAKAAKKAADVAADKVAKAAEKVATERELTVSGEAKKADKVFLEGARAAAKAAATKSTAISKEPVSVGEISEQTYKELYVESRYPQRNMPRAVTWMHVVPPIPRWHVVLLDGGTIIFGIVVGLLALLNQGYVNELRSIGNWEVLALLGIGLTIGSIHSQS